MAFSKAPSVSTHQTDDVKIIYELNSRDQTGSKDVMALNGFFDIIKNKKTQDNDYFFVKRDGTSTYAYSITGTLIRGAYYWKDQDKLFIAYDTKIDIITGSTGVFVATVTPFATTTGDVGFTEFQYSTGTVKLVATDGVRLITIDTSNTVVTGADVDQPAAFEPHVVYLDGYLLLVKSGTADIYNSGLDDPLAWTAGNFISAEMLPDTLTRIARLNNYIVALGTGSIEYFFDAANASGSPLQRNDTPVKKVGYMGGLISFQNRILFVGKSPETNPEVFMLEDLRMETIATPPLRRYLTPYTTIEGNLVSYGGKDFYIITVGTITYQMDLETKLWTRLAYQNGTTFPIKYSVNLPISGVGNTSLFTRTSNLVPCYFNPNVFQDSSVNYTMECRTDNQSFDTSHQKTMSRAFLHGDRTSSTANTDISWTDDDYQTYSTARSVDMSINNPFITRLGIFRRRAFKVSYTGSLFQRWIKVEVDYNIGIG